MAKTKIPFNPNSAGSIYAAVLVSMVTKEPFDFVIDHKDKKDPIETWLKIRKPITDYQSAKPDNKKLFAKRADLLQKAKEVPSVFWATNVPYVLYAVSESESTQGFKNSLPIQTYVEQRLSSLKGEDAKIVEFSLVYSRSMFDKWVEVGQAILEADLSKGKKSAWDSHVATYEKQIKQKNAEIKKLREALDKKNGQVEKLLKEADGLKANIEQLEKKVTALDNAGRPA